MSKISVRFLRTHGAYVKGDIAGFSKAQADAFEAAKPPIAEKLGPVKAKAPADNPAAQEQEQALAKRMAELDAREAEIAEREAGVAEKEAGGAVEAPDDGETQKGKPPAQGAKAK